MITLALVTWSIAGTLIHSIREMSDQDPPVVPAVKYITIEASTSCQAPANHNKTTTPPTIIIE